MMPDPLIKEKDDNKNFTTQLPRNLGSNIAYFLVNLTIGILLVPYFISTLGIAAYGLIPLATSITGYVGLVVLSLNTVVSRYLTIDLQREDYRAANRTFNTAFFGLSSLIVLMIPVVLLVALYAPDIFNVPAGQEIGTSLLILGVCTAFLIQTWSGNFTVQLFAYNRLDLQNLVSITNIIFNTGFIIFFFTLYEPNLAFIGYAYLIGACASSAVAIFLAKRVCPYLKVSYFDFTLSRLKDLGGMMWWVIINQIGALLFLQIDLLIVNLLFGATSSGEYAIALKLAVLLRGIAAMLAGVLTPIIITYYAKEQPDKLIRVSKSAVKIMGLAIALPIGFICGFAPQILNIWVGSEYMFIAPLLVVLTIHLSLNLAVLPLFSINIAYNRILIPGLVTIGMGIVNVLLAVFLSSLTGWGYYGVAVAGAIMLTTKNAFFTPWYATRVLNIAAHTFTKAMIPGVVATISLVIFAGILSQFFPFASLFPLLIIGLFITVVYCAFTWKIGFNEFERGIFSTYVPSSIWRLLI